MQIQQLPFQQQLSSIYSYLESVYQVKTILKASAHNLLSMLYSLLNVFQIAQLSYLCNQQLLSLTPFKDDVTLTTNMDMIENKALCSDTMYNVIVPSGESSMFTRNKLHFVVWNRFG